MKIKNIYIYLASRSINEYTIMRNLNKLLYLNITLTVPAQGTFKKGFSSMNITSDISQYV